MQSAVGRKEGPRAPLFRLLTALLIPFAASAQDAVDRTELARCAALASADDRLACFESLASEPNAPADADDTDSDAENEATTPAAAMRNASKVDADAEVARESGRTTAVVQPRTERIPAAAPDDLGAEHLEREDEAERPDTVNAVVEEVWKGGNRLLYFRFSNGQIWRQMESGYFHYPRDAAFDVTIRQSFMGDYQMRRTGSARMTRIVRVK